VNIENENEQLESDGAMAEAEIENQELMDSQELLDFQKGLIEINKRIAELTKLKKEKSAEILEYLKGESKDRIKSTLGTSYILRRKSYKYSSEIEAMSEEMKLAKKEEEEKALTPVEMETLLEQYKQDPKGTNTDVPFYKESETLAFRETKTKELKDEITIK